MMEQMMKMFAPFGSQEAEDLDPEVPISPVPPAREIDDLRRRLDELEREIGGIGKPQTKA
jgi:polyhydroxyalkanoate synthesis regulator protein